ncbi:MAG: PP2C family protein-serine/threonine phosphatase [Kiritimatiellia bacterium]
MKRTIRVLLFEPDAEAALGILKELSKGEFEVEALRVATLDELKSAICGGSWDTVLYGHQMAEFNSLEALRVVRELLPDVPFIILADPEAEASAIQVMKAGAQDYLLKGQLQRLLPVVERELREAAERQARRNLERVALEQLQELRIGREIQQRLFPAAAPVMPGFDIAGACYPAAATGGDYFDYIRIGDGSLLIVVGDVAGHGIGPALLMADVRACLRALSLACDDPAEILYRANQLLLEDLGVEHYVTLILMRLCAGQRTLPYVNAGHIAGCVVGRDGLLREELSVTVPALGLFPYPERPQTRTVALHNGDLILLFTDGLTEASSSDGEEFGLARVVEVAANWRAASASAIVEKLYEAVRQFREEEPQQDDITMVVVKMLSNSQQSN